MPVSGACNSLRAPVSSRLRNLSHGVLSGCLKRLIGGYPLSEVSQLSHPATSAAEKRARAAQLLASGMTVSRAARTVGVGRATLNRWRKDFPSEFSQAKPAEPEDVHRALLEAVMNDPGNTPRPA